ncbi:MAG TPA: SEC-C metal-binding domain-containing protein, partial [Solirubrobacterales bacterium]|nr:SEC-C metal-binding domain-containing protein [Solirubrobacterales bacterium]
RDMSEIAREEIDGVIGRLVDEFMAGDIIEEWDLPGLDSQLHQIWPCAIDVAGLPPESTEPEALKQDLCEDAQKAYDEREAEFGEEIMRYLERTLLMQVIDSRWREHLYDMDYLREGIHLRGFAQIDPLVAYKNEGYTMFQELMNGIWEEFSRLIYNVEIEIEPDQNGSFAPPAEEPDEQTYDYSGGTMEAQPSALAEVAAGATPGPADAGGVPGVVPGGVPNVGGAVDPANSATVVKTEREDIGRNDPCWCGSGKKYKKCHGQ